jgi:Uma2 family endonuclease
MGDALVKQQYLSFPEYEALEKAAYAYRYEFIDGVVWAMAGASTAHNQIIQNIAFAFRNYFRTKGCRVFTESVKLEVSAGKRYVYPDVMLTCSQMDKQSSFMVREPFIVVEVLSDSTENKDLKEKVDVYLAMESLQAYIIIDQKQCWLRIYERGTDNKWLPHVALVDIADKLVLKSGFEISLQELYEDIEFKSAEA